MAGLFAGPQNLYENSLLSYERIQALNDAQDARYGTIDKANSLRPGVAPPTNANDRARPPVTQVPPPAPIAGPQAGLVKPNAYYDQLGADPGKAGVTPQQAPATVIPLGGEFEPNPDNPQMVEGVRKVEHAAKVERMSTDFAGERAKMLQRIGNGGGGSPRMNILGGFISAAGLNSANEEKYRGEFKAMYDWFSSPAGESYIRGNPGVMEELKNGEQAFALWQQLGHPAAGADPIAGKKLTPEQQAAAKKADANPSAPLKVTINNANRTRKAPPRTIKQVAKAAPRKSIAAKVTANPNAKPEWVAPNAVNMELQTLNHTRSQLYHLADLYKRQGPGASGKYIDTVLALDRVNNAMVHASWQKAVNLLDAGDGRMLAKLWSQEYKKDYRLIPRSDGKWDMTIDGQPAGAARTTASITSKQRSDMSLATAKAFRAAGIARDSESLKSRRKLHHAAIIQALKAKDDKALERLKAQLGFKTQKGPDESTIAVFGDGRAYQYSIQPGKSLDGEGKVTEVFTRSRAQGGGAPAQVLGNAGGDNGISAVFESFRTSVFGK